MDHKKERGLLEYQYNADAFENYLRDNAANDNKNKEIIMQKDKNVR